LCTTSIGPLHVASIRFVSLPTSNSAIIYLLYIIIYIASLKMNYDGAEGLEFGGGNTKVDPSVLSGQQPSGTHEWKSMNTR
jgi:hypothetical protein